ncbi:N-acetyltransferase family protein [Profundibacter sp.]
MIIRTATTSDASDMTALLNEIIRIGGTTAFQKEWTAGTSKAFIKKLQTTGCIHLARDKKTGALLGYQSLEAYPDLPKTLGIIATFSKVGGTKRGIGTALFAVTSKAAPTLGFTEIDATIRADNAGGLAYYSKMGFADHSVTKAVPLDDGTLVDRISKRLVLLN